VPTDPAAREIEVHVTPAETAPDETLSDGTRPRASEEDAPRILRARRAFVDGAFRAADVVIARGVIVEVGDSGETGAAGADVVEIPADVVLLPGLVDSHVHVNEPGRTEWEGFASATLAAAAGGVTTIVDMPLNSIPPTTTVDALDIKREAANATSYVDVAFWGGAIPGNLGRLAPLWDAGVAGFKSFLAPSGVDEFPALDRDQLEAAMAEVASLGAVLIVHAEDPALLHDDRAVGRSYQRFLASRPPASERSAIEAVIAAMRRTGARAHILHLADAQALDLIRAAKAEGLPLTVETCPHYLTLLAEEIPDGASEFKCCPPIRDRANQDLLWEGVLDGTIDAIVTDHSPSTVDLKRAGDGDFGIAWGGISSLQLGLSAVWTRAWQRGISLEQLLPKFTTGPATVAGLPGRGEIRVGVPAHLTAFAPDDELLVDAEQLLHRNPITAYHGRSLRGRVRMTWLAGRVVFDAVRGGVGAAGPDRGPARGRLLRARAVSPR
jgi:allantoinase